MAIDPGTIMSAASLLGLGGGGGEQGVPRDLLVPQERQMTALWSALYPMLMQQAQFAAMNEPARQAITMKLVRQLMNTDVGAQIENFANSQRQQAMGQARQNQAIGRQMGLGSGFESGALLDANNRAQTATNDYTKMVRSPQYQAQGMQGALGALMGGMNMPGLSNFLNVHSSLKAGATPQVNNGTDLGGLLGGIASQMDWGKIFGFNKSSGGSSGGGFQGDYSVKW